MITFEWIEVEPNNWQGTPRPSRAYGPVVDVWKPEDDSVWFFNVQEHGWDDTFDGAKRVAERVYKEWIAMHPEPRVAKERAAVVTFLRGARLDELADAVMRGEHHTEEEP